MARTKLVGRLAAAVIRRADTISTCLFLAGIAGFLALPLAGKAIYHDENALLVGHAESVIRCVCYSHDFEAAPGAHIAA
jgi:hypothetical protein